MNRYVHGYSPRESQRLSEQSGILEALMHGDIHFEPGSRVLEAGCGVGAQTRILLRRHPDIALTAVDLSDAYLAQAAAALENEAERVVFQQADIHDLPFPAEHFDHVFLCFVLEHLDHPASALAELKRVLKKGGTVTAIEGDHESCLWHPASADATAMWNAMIKVQQHAGHDPLIGRRLYPLFIQAGLTDVAVVPKPVYVDFANPAAKHDALFKILVPMAHTAREKALDLGLISAATWDRGFREFGNVGNAEDGTLFYTWFSGTGKR